MFMFMQLLQVMGLLWGLFRNLFETRQQPDDDDGTIDDTPAGDDPTIELELESPHAGRRRRRRQQQQRGQQQQQDQVDPTTGLPLRLPVLVQPPDGTTATTATATTATSGIPPPSSSTTSFSPFKVTTTADGDLNAPSAPRRQRIQLLLPPAPVSYEAAPDREVLEATFMNMMLMRRRSGTGGGGTHGHIVRQVLVFRETRPPPPPPAVPAANIPDESLLWYVGVASASSATATTITQFESDLVGVIMGTVSVVSGCCGGGGGTGINIREFSAVWTGGAVGAAGATETSSVGDATRSSTSSGPKEWERRVLMTTTMGTTSQRLPLLWYRIWMQKRKVAVVQQKEQEEEETQVAGVVEFVRWNRVSGQPSCVQFVQFGAMVGNNASAVGVDDLLVNLPAPTPIIAPNEEEEQEEEQEEEGEGGKMEDRPPFTFGTFGSAFPVLLFRQKKEEGQQQQHTEQQQRHWSEFQFDCSPSSDSPTPSEASSAIPPSLLIREHLIQPTHVSLAQFIRLRQQQQQEQLSSHHLSTLTFSFPTNRVAIPRDARLGFFTSTSKGPEVEIEEEVGAEEEEQGEREEEVEEKKALFRAPVNVSTYLGVWEEGEAGVEVEEEMTGEEEAGEEGGRKGRWKVIVVASENYVEMSRKKKRRDDED